MQLTYNLTQATKLLGIHADTLKNYEKQGKITPSRTEGGHRRYTIKQLCKLINATVSIPIVPLLIQIEERYRNFEELFAAFEQGRLMKKNIEAIQLAQQKFSHYFHLLNPTINLPYISKDITKEPTQNKTGHFYFSNISTNQKAQYTTNKIFNFEEEIGQHISHIVERRLLEQGLILPTPMYTSVYTPQIKFGSKISMPDKPIYISVYPQDGYIKIHWEQGAVNPSPNDVYLDCINYKDFSKDVLYEHLNYPYALKGIA